MTIYDDPEQPLAERDRLLSDLQTEVVRKALEKVKEGDSAWGRIARDILKDSGISTNPKASPEAMELANSLPFTGGDE